MSDEWFDALDQAARRAEVDPALDDVSLTIEQRIEDGPAWRLVIDGGTVRVTRRVDEGDADVRFTSSRTTARSMARGERSALEAFIAGELRVGGDIGTLLDHRVAIETLGDVFASVRPDDG